MRRLVLVVLSATLVSLPGVAFAQEDPRKAQAESAFAEGLKLHDANRDADALVKYRQAYSTYPTPNILFAIARMEQVLGQSVAAITHFREALKIDPRLPGLRGQHRLGAGRAVAGRGGAGCGARPAVQRAAGWRRVLRRAAAAGFGLRQPGQGDGRQQLSVGRRRRGVSAADALGDVVGCWRLPAIVVAVSPVSR